MLEVTEFLNYVCCDSGRYAWRFTGYGKVWAITSSQPISENKVDFIVCMRVKTEHKIDRKAIWREWTHPENLTRLSYFILLWWRAGQHMHNMQV